MNFFFFVCDKILAYQYLLEMQLLFLSCIFCLNVITLCSSLYDGSSNFEYIEKWEQKFCKGLKKYFQIIPSSLSLSSQVMLPICCPFLLQGEVGLPTMTCRKPCIRSTLSCPEFSASLTRMGTNSQQVGFQIVKQNYISLQLSLLNSFNISLYLPFWKWADFCDFHRSRHSKVTL